MCERLEKINAMIERVLSGEKLKENEIADVMCGSRDLVALTIAKNIIDENYEDMSSVEDIDIDHFGSGRKSYKRKDIFRIFNVLQNAIERHELRHGSSKDPMAAMESVWQSVADRAMIRNES